MAGYGGILTRDLLLMISPMARGVYTPANNSSTSSLWSSLSSSSIKSSSNLYFKTFNRVLWKTFSVLSVQVNLFLLSGTALHLVTWSLQSSGQHSTALNDTLHCVQHRYCNLHFCILLHHTMWDCTDCYCNLMKAHCSATVLGKRVQCIFWPLQTLFCWKSSQLCKKISVLSSLNAHPISLAGRWKYVFWFVQMRTHFSAEHICARPLKWGWNIWNGQCRGKSLSSLSVAAHPSCTFEKSTRIFFLATFQSWIEFTNPIVYLLQLVCGFTHLIFLLIIAQFYTIVYSCKENVERNAVEWQCPFTKIALHCLASWR